MPSRTWKSGALFSTENQLVFQARIDLYLVTVLIGWNSETPVDFYSASVIELHGRSDPAFGIACTLA